LAVETLDDPPEAYVLQLAGREPVRVSAANVDLPKVDLGRTEIIRWKSKDGLEIEGLLTYPVNYLPGRRYPLVLSIHGGPDNVAGDTFVGGHPVATLGTRGYAVLQPNPRGSIGYGKAFRSALYSKGGTTDYDDNQAGLDRVIAMGVADPRRLAVVGYSYGGYMAARSITQTQRVKAAVMWAGGSNLVSLEAAQDVAASLLPEWVGSEWSKRLDYYRKHSPISYVQNANTPTLILHGEQDVVSQGYEMYFALKRQGVPVEMVVFPRQGHTFQEPKMDLELRRRLHAWVAKYIGG
jgi:dipeptidyl aminopeptidase/acylaminoacyl peptidase